MANNYYTEASNDKYTYGGAPQMSPNNFNDDEEGSFNIMEWVHRFLKYWYLFIAAIIITLSLGYLKCRSWKPVYKTESKIIIESSASGGNYSFMQGFGMGSDLYTANNQLLILSSYNLINRATSKLPFNIDYYTRGRFKTNSLYGREPIQLHYTDISPEAYMMEYRFLPIDEENFVIKIENIFSPALEDKYKDYSIKGRYGEVIENNLFFAKIDKLYLPLEPNPDGFLFVFRTQRSLEDEFAGRLAISYIGEASSVVGVSLTGNVVARDRDFLNMLGQEFLASNLEDKNEEAVRTIDFINDQMSYIADSLRSSEVRLRQFRRENNMVDVNGYTSSILAKLSALDAKRSELNLQEVYFDDLYGYLNKSIENESLVAPSSLGISDPILLELVNNFNDLQQRRSDVGVKNPNYERYSKKMEDVRKTLIAVLGNVKNIHKMERKAFEDEYRSTLSELKDLPEKEMKMVNFERAYKVNDNYYTFLLQKQSEAQIRKASNISDNKVLQEARVSPVPVNGGEKSKIYLMMFAVGLLLPAIFVVLKELMNVTIRTIEDVVKITKLPIIGSIRRAKNASVAMAIRNPKSLYMEAFRLIRTRIGFITQHKDKVLVSVTSAESGDGKTHFVQDLAGICGMVSKKVVLIDMDIRNPNLTKKMELSDSNGLVHYLVGSAKLDEVIVKNSELNFDFIPAGVVPPNPAELIASDQFKQLVALLQEKYDYVIFDSSPLGLVSDAYPLCSMADINIIVTRADKSNKNIFASFVSQITQDSMPNAYVVLNDVDAESVKKYGKYYYGKYSYGQYVYGAGNYHENEKKYYDNEVV